MAKLIVVTGATGNQGRAVISAFLKDGTYKVRGVTRNTSSENAQNLAAKGVEMVSADLNDEESLVTAFRDATVIYAITDFFESFAKSGPGAAMEVEFSQGTSLARAASRTPTLEHYLWSTLPNSRVLSNRKWVVPHFDAKNQIDDYIRTTLATSLLPKTTFFWIAFYASNFFYPPFTPNLLKSAGKYVLLEPAGKDTPIETIADVEANVGLFALRTVQKPELTRNGKTVLASVEKMTIEEFLQSWGGVTDKNVSYIEVSLEDYDKLWPIWGREMGLMMKFWNEAKEKSWTIEGSVTDVVKGSDLGLEVGKDGLAGLSETIRSMNWDSTL